LSFSILRQILKLRIQASILRQILKLRIQAPILRQTLKLRIQAQTLDLKICPLCRTVYLLVASLSVVMERTTTAMESLMTSPHSTATTSGGVGDRELGFVKVESSAAIMESGAVVKMLFILMMKNSVMVLMMIVTGVSMKISS